MFLDSYFKSNTSISKLAKEGSTFSAGYDYWINALFERAVRLFVWKGPEDDGVPNKEIEIALMMNGSAGVTNKYRNKIAVFNGAFSGSPTVYYDE